MNLTLSSALPTHLKLVAVAMVSHAAAEDDPKGRWKEGDNIFPSMSRVARLVSKSRRQTIRGVQELERMGIVVPNGTSHLRTTRYRFEASRLPMVYPRDAGKESSDSDTDVTVPPALTSDTDVTYRDVCEGVTGDTPMVTLATVMVSPKTRDGDIGDTRSGKEQVIEQETTKNHAAQAASDASCVSVEGSSEIEAKAVNAVSTLRGAEGAREQLAGSSSNDVAARQAGLLLGVKRLRSDLQRQEQQRVAS